jgi:hypothetical protein
MKFKPTTLTFIFLIGLSAFCIFHIPVSVAWPVFGLGISLSFMFYHFGKISVINQTNAEKEYTQILTQAEQIKDILSMPLIKLFPDIQEILLGNAIEKFTAIGEDQKVKELQATLQEIA